MIEVTDEMLTLLREYQMGAYGELDDYCDKHIIAALIELHEANKPKPEPYGWWSDWYGDWCNEDDKGAFPLYTTPPTRKPLSEDVIVDVYENSGYKQTLRPQDRFAVMSFARAIEQAHGIK